MNDKQLEQIADELSDIKRLLVLQLQQQKVKGEDIASALGVSKGTVSKLTQKTKYGKTKEAPTKEATNGQRH